LAFNADVRRNLNNGCRPPWPEVARKIQTARKNVGSNISPPTLAALEYKSLVRAWSHGTGCEWLWHVYENDKTAACTLKLPHVKHRSRIDSVVAAVRIKMQIAVW
jgi:hypothetical protein